MSMTFAAAFALVVSQLGVDKIPVDKRQFQCMAEAVYFEAGNQTYVGKIAVSNVILNRQRATGNRLDICAVIHQPKQFSYLQMKAYKHQKINMKNPNVALTIRDSVTVALAAIQSKLPDVTAGAGFYINPVYATGGKWRHKFVLTASIGDHFFYKDPKAGKRKLYPKVGHQKKKSILASPVTV